MRRYAVPVGATLAGVALLVWAERALGPRHALFAFLVVWVPMTGLGAVSHVVRVRLPGRLHELRGWERSGRVYERLGVRVAKRALRRGPLAVFNPGLHLPADRSPAGVARLDAAMRVAEASHLICFAASLGFGGLAAVLGWWAAAAWTSLFDVVLNGYPVMLQRYNRAELARRYGPVATATGPGASTPFGGVSPSGSS